ncbi:zinc finger CCCH domain-containing protein 67-like isoform X1 [Punica granatum]|uniref:Zinc finger CCCH domain-containing protein 67-like isoform X1 n=1 Tax=Punica granatum TaxID=22663 RepID=A0A6P8E517_PUNGR|nr:zinc finger CCCH domain-containing protein 67-like isoform X1 [Punica granatum]
MESKNFFKWFFSPNSASSAAPSEGSSSSSPTPAAAAAAAMPSPDGKSNPAPPDSDNAPPDPHPQAGDQLSAKVQELDLKEPEPEPAGQEPQGGVPASRERYEGRAEEVKHDRDEHTEEEKRNEDGNESDKDGDDQKEEEEEEEERGFGRKNKFPVRPDAEDCAFYMKTGTCKFGSNCKFNHPIRRKPQVVAKERVKDREESKDKTGQVECKYYLTPGGCKYGKACRFSHSKANPVAPAPAVELNFLGLPIRPGEKECPFYMRTGTCKFAANCKFNHPDPTSGGDPPMEFSNGGSTPLQNASQFPVWSPSGTLNNECTPYVPMMYSPTQVVSSPNAEWNFQFPLNPQGQSMHPAPAYIMNSPTTTESHIYTNHQQQMAVEEFPERPGQPECSYFLKTGDCKFKSNCKYHHPKDRVQKSPQVALSDKGLPLRPDQNICSYYSRYGICKFGPACKFDHSMQLAPSGLEKQPSMKNCPGEDDPRMGRPRTAGEPTAI